MCKKMKVNLSSPWCDFTSKVKALFEFDNDVNVILDEREGANPILRIYVDKVTKSEAIKKLLPPAKEFGNVTLTIEVLPPNAEANEDVADTLCAAFDGNPIFLGIKKDTSSLFPRPQTYVMFEREVVQYFNDNLADYNGLRSTLYQELAKEVFETPANIYYCTEPEDDDDDLPFI